ncbi:MAG: DUF805 domain-containing protein [Bacteroidales bacterium]|nr:DUF805 domain-containing protein [Bacteroidales bacterium]
MNDEQIKQELLKAGWQQNDIDQEFNSSISVATPTPSSTSNQSTITENRGIFYYYLAVFKRYFVFAGRARRKEYWSFFLINFIISVLLAIIGLFIFTDGSVLGYIFALITFIPGIAVGVRRLHDTNHGGWWIFISLIPLIGIIIFLVFMFKKGQVGVNQYGPDPKTSEEDAKPTNIFLIIGTIILLIAIGVLGYVYLIKPMQSGKNIIKNSDTYAGLLTYKEVNKDFEFQYPSSMRFTSHAYNNLDDPRGSLGIGLVSSDNNLKLELMVNPSGQGIEMIDEYKSQQSINVDGEEGYIDYLFFIDSPESRMITAQFNDTKANDEYFLNISFNQEHQQEAENLINQILSTFKFTETEETTQPKTTEPITKNCGSAEFVKSTNSGTGSGDGVSGSISISFPVPKTTDDKKSLTCFDNALIDCQKAKISIAVEGEDDYDAEIKGVEGQNCLFVISSISNGIKNENKICKISLKTMSWIKTELDNSSLKKDEGWIMRILINLAFGGELEDGTKIECVNN